VFEAVRRCAPPDREDGARVSDPCLRTQDPRHASRKLAPRFPKASKLLRHADFQRVYKQGRRHFAAHMTVFYLRREEDDGAGPRVGLTVGRVLGGAVQRNRIKRRLREAVRHHLASLALAVDVVINPKKSALVAEFTLLNDEVARAFQVIAEKESRRA
jgi:ribonuclease P protein component